MIGLNISHKAVNNLCLTCDFSFLYRYLKAKGPYASRLLNYFFLIIILPSFSMFCMAERESM